MRNRIEVPIYNYFFNKMEIKKRKPRRTKMSLEKDFMNAIKSVIEEDGFSNTTLASIVERANIVPNVFYNRYGSIDELFEEYVKRYDYWLVDIVEIVEPKDIQNYSKTFETILTGLTEALYNNKSMQQILLWELAEENHITLRSSKLREANASELIDNFNEAYKSINKNLDIRVTSALLIAGIYYLILHRNRSTFCNIDFSKKEGKELLIKTIQDLTELIYRKNDQNEQLFEIAKKLKNRGVDIDTISDAVGLEIEVVRKI